MSIAGRRKFATIALIVVLVEIVLEVGWDLIGVLLMGGLFTTTGDWTEVYDLVMVLFGLTFVLSYLVSALAFIRWQRQVSRGLLLIDPEPLDPGVTLSSWSWFIPVANLFLPYLSLRQIARRTVPAGKAASIGLVRAWWICWLLANLGSWFINVLFMFADEPKIWITATTVDVIMQMPLILAGLLALQMIRRFSDQLEAGLARRTATPGIGNEFGGPGNDPWQSPAP